MAHAPSEPSEVHSTDAEREIYMDPFCVAHRAQGSLLRARLRALLALGERALDEERTMGHFERVCGIMDVDSTFHHMSNFETTAAMMWLNHPARLKQFITKPEDRMGMINSVLRHIQCEQRGTAAAGATS
jgi:hypothetical protein